MILGPRRARLHPHRPDGHAGTTLNDTATGFTTALAKVRPSIDAKRKVKGHKTQETNKTALIHDKQIEKTLFNKLCALAQTRLLGIISHRQQKIREQATGVANRGTQPATNDASSHPLVASKRLICMFRLKSYKVNTAYGTVRGTVIPIFGRYDQKDGHSHWSPLTYGTV